MSSCSQPLFIVCSEVTDRLASGSLSIGFLADVVELAGSFAKEKSTRVSLEDASEVSEIISPPAQEILRPPQSFVLSVPNTKGILLIYLLV